MAKEDKYAQVRLPSGEVRRVPMSAKATIGQVGNADHELIMYGKAGRIRHKGCLLYTSFRDSKGDFLQKVPFGGAWGGAP